MASAAFKDGASGASELKIASNRGGTKADVIARRDAWQVPHRSNL